MRYSRTTIVLLQLFITILIFLGSSVNGSRKKVVLRMPKKPKQIHHHHHYVVMQPMLSAATPYLLPQSSRPIPLSYDKSLPIHLSQASTLHNDYTEYPSSFNGGNDLRKTIHNMDGYISQPKHKIIRNIPTTSMFHDDDFNDPTLHETYSHHQPITIHKSRPDYFYHSYSNYNKKPAHVEHIYTEEVQHEYK